MSNFDLSSAFEVENINLLLKYFRVDRLPADLVALIEILLTDRMFFVEVQSTTSIFHESNPGTIQGLILGPILYATFVAPLFDVTDLFNFADDNFTLAISNSKQHAIGFSSSLLTERGCSPSELAGLGQIVSIFLEFTIFHN